MGNSVHVPSGENSPTKDTFDQHLKRSVFEASIWVTAHMSMSTSNLDHAATRQGCVQPGCEVHLPNYLLSVKMHENKVEVYTSVQLHTRDVAGL